MLFLPPGSAKSTYASDLFPAWYLAGGARSIIATSNTADLAQAFSRRVRSRVREHREILGYQLDREAEEMWTTTAGGQYRAAGVGGAITGFRADLALIDDPIKSREQADSESYREKVWQWWQDELQTRLRPGAAAVLISTRWHQDDLAGRLLERQRDAWRVLSIPAMADAPDDPLGRRPGEALWGDDDYGYAADLELKRQASDARTWSALYQQQPSPETGDFFKAEWFRPMPAFPARESMRIYGASDYAVTRDGGDYTVHLVVGIDANENLFLLDLWRGQQSPDVWIDAFCDLVERWKPIGWGEETGQIKGAVGPFLEQRMSERFLHVARDQFAARGDKSVRAQSIRGRMAMRGLSVPETAPWWPAFRSELLSFPAGKHDDQVDALGLVGQMLDRMHGPKVKVSLNVPSLGSYGYAA